MNGAKKGSKERKGRKKKWKKARKEKWMDGRKGKKRKEKERKNETLVLPLSKLYCLDNISDQYLKDSVLSFLGFSSLFTASASMCLLNSASGIFCSVS